LIELNFAEEETFLRDCSRLIEECLIEVVAIRVKYQVPALNESEIVVTVGFCLYKRSQVIKEQKDVLAIA
jgi:hypothetical protein